MSVKEVLFDELKMLRATKGYLFTSHQLLVFKNKLTPPEIEELQTVIRELCDTGFFEEKGGLKLTDRGYTILWNS